MALEVGKGVNGADAKKAVLRLDERLRAGQTTSWMNLSPNFFEAVCCQTIFGWLRPHRRSMPSDIESQTGSRQHCLIISLVVTDHPEGVRPACPLCGGAHTYCACQTQSGLLTVTEWRARALPLEHVVSPKSHGSTPTHSCVFRSRSSPLWRRTW